MNAVDIILLILIAAAVAAAVIGCLRSRKRGGCGGCSSYGSCPYKNSGGCENGKSKEKN